MNTQLQLLSCCLLIWFHGLGWAQYCILKNQYLNIGLDPKFKISQFFWRPYWIQSAGWAQPWNIERVSVLHWEEFNTSILGGVSWLDPRLFKRGGNNQGPRVHILLESGLVCFDVLTSAITIQQKRESKQRNKLILTNRLPQPPLL